MVIGKTAPWAALGVSLVVHLTGIGIVSAIVLPTAQPESQASFIVSTDSVPPAESLEPVELQLDQWRPNPGGGGSSNSLGEAVRTELTVNPESLVAGRLEIGGGTDLNWTEALGDGGSGGGTGGGHGTGNGDGIGDGDGFFGLDLTGDRIVFVVDASRSMNAPYPGEAKNRLGRVKIEIYNTVRKMTADQKFFVVFFNTEPIPMPAQDLILAEPSIARPYMEWIFKMKAQGQTDPQAALLLALRLRPDKVYFLTDGDFSHRAVKTVREVNRGRIPIHTVGFGGQEGEANLKEIAQDSRATYQYIPAPTVTAEPAATPPAQAARSVPKDAPAVAKPQ
jgi:hypothetical protein